MRVDIRQDSMIEVTDDDRQLHREVETPVGVLCRTAEMKTRQTTWLDRYISRQRAKEPSSLSACAHHQSSRIAANYLL
jgi:hypothetical protein